MAKKKKPTTVEEQAAEFFEREQAAYAERMKQAEIDEANSAEAETEEKVSEDLPDDAPGQQDENNEQGEQ